MVSGKDVSGGLDEDDGYLYGVVVKSVKCFLEMYDLNY